MGSEDTQGERVDFGPLREALREHQYPVTRTELIEVYGGFELDLPEGPSLLEDVLGRVDRETFREPHDVRDAILDGAAAADAFRGSLDDVRSVADDDEWSRKSV
ncbi:DUF5789 family protein [Halorubrum sp. DTA98]|uniref:DUF5789 family protein n=1 Tax=Halorubrum sp. DTA98 TaxID=3402163 RepID=UPI003AB0AD0B